MNILEIDPGTYLGWALGIDGKPSYWGVQTFDLRRGESPGIRYLRLRGWLKDMAVNIEKLGFSLNLIVYEQVHHRGGAATEIAYGMVTHIQEWAAEIKAETASVHSATLKKFATGSGRADKAAMIKAARDWIKSIYTKPCPSAQHHIIISDDNVADALMILKMAIRDYKCV